MKRDEAGRECPGRPRGDDDRSSFTHWVKVYVIPRISKSTILALGGLLLVAAIVSVSGMTAGKAQGQEGIDEVVNVYAWGNRSCALTKSGEVYCWGQGMGGRAHHPPDNVHLHLGQDKMVILNGIGCFLQSDGKPRCWGKMPDNFDQSIWDTKFSKIVGRSISAVAGGFEENANHNKEDWDQAPEQQAFVNEKGQTINYIDGGAEDTKRASLHPQTYGVHGGDGALMHAHYGLVMDVATGRERQFRVLPRVSGNVKTYEIICGLTKPPDNKVKCWGSPELMDIGMALPSEVEFTDLTLGAGFACGITATSPVRRHCQGYYAESQKDPLFVNFINVLYHKDVGSLGAIKSIKAGAAHVCVLTASDVRCRGNKEYQAGEVTRDVELSSGVLEGGSILASHSKVDEWGVGKFFSCALKMRGTIECKGSNLFGESKPPTAVPAVRGKYRGIAVGDYHACATNEKAPYVECWGWNAYGQTDVPTNLAQGLPKPGRVRQVKVQIARVEREAPTLEHPRLTPTPAPTPPPSPTPTPTPVHENDAEFRIQWLPPYRMAETFYTRSGYYNVRIFLDKGEVRAGKSPQAAEHSMGSDPAKGPWTYTVGPRQHHATFGMGDIKKEDDYEFEVRACYMTGGAPDPKTDEDENRCGEWTGPAAAPGLDPEAFRNVNTTPNPVYDLEGVAMNNRSVHLQWEHESEEAETPERKSILYRVRMLTGQEYQAGGSESMLINEGMAYYKDEPFRKLSSHPGQFASAVTEGAEEEELRAVTGFFTPRRAPKDIPAIYGFVASRIKPDQVGKQDLLRSFITARLEPHQAVPTQYLAGFMTPRYPPAEWVNRDQIRGFVTARNYPTPAIPKGSLSGFVTPRSAPLGDVGAKSLGDFITHYTAGKNILSGFYTPRHRLPHWEHREFDAAPENVVVAREWITGRKKIVPVSTVVTTVPEYDKDTGKLTQNVQTTEHGKREEYEFTATGDALPGQCLGIASWTASEVREWKKAHPFATSAITMYTKRGDPVRVSPFLASDGVTLQVHTVIDEHPDTSPSGRANMYMPDSRFTEDGECYVDGRPFSELYSPNPLYTYDEGRVSTAPKPVDLDQFTDITDEMKEGITAGTCWIKSPATIATDGQLLYAYPKIPIEVTRLASVITLDGTKVAGFIANSYLSNRGFCLTGSASFTHLYYQPPGDLSPEQARFKRQLSATSHGGKEAGLCYIPDAGNPALDGSNSYSYYTENGTLLKVTPAGPPLPEISSHVPAQSTLDKRKTLGWVVGAKLVRNGVCKIGETGATFTRLYKRAPVELRLDPDTARPLPALGQTRRTCFITEASPDFKASSTAKVGTKVDFYAPTPNGSIAVSVQFHVGKIEDSSSGTKQTHVIYGFLVGGQFERDGRCNVPGVGSVSAIYEYPPRMGDLYRADSAGNLPLTTYMAPGTETLGKPVQTCFVPTDIGVRGADGDQLTASDDGRDELDDITGSGETYQDMYTPNGNLANVMFIAKASIIEDRGSPGWTEGVTRNAQNKIKVFGYVLGGEWVRNGVCRVGHEDLDTLYFDPPQAKLAPGRPEPEPLPKAVADINPLLAQEGVTKGQCFISRAVGLSEGTHFRYGRIDLSSLTAQERTDLDSLKSGEIGTSPLLPKIAGLAKNTPANDKIKRQTFYASYQGGAKAVIVRFRYAPKAGTDSPTFKQILDSSTGTEYQWDYHGWIVNGELESDGSCSVPGIPGTVDRLYLTPPREADLSRTNSAGAIPQTRYQVTDAKKTMGEIEQSCFVPRSVNAAIAGKHYNNDADDKDASGAVSLDTITSKFTRAMWTPRGNEAVVEFLPQDDTVGGSTIQDLGGRFQSGVDELTPSDKGPDDGDGWVSVIGVVQNAQYSDGTAGECRLNGEPFSYLYFDQLQQSPRRPGSPLIEGVTTADPAYRLFDPAWLGTIDQGEMAAETCFFRSVQPSSSTYLIDKQAYDAAETAYQTAKADYDAAPGDTAKETAMVNAEKIRDDAKLKLNDAWPDAHARETWYTPDGSEARVEFIGQEAWATALKAYETARTAHLGDLGDATKKAAYDTARNKFYQIRDDGDPGNLGDVYEPTWVRVKGYIVGSKWSGDGTCRVNNREISVIYKERNAVDGLLLEGPDSRPEGTCYIKKTEYPTAPVDKESEHLYTQGGRLEEIIFQPETVADYSSGQRKDIETVGYVRGSQWVREGGVCEVRQGDEFVLLYNKRGYERYKNAQERDYKQFDVEQYGDGSRLCKVADSAAHLFARPEVLFTPERQSVGIPRSNFGYEADGTPISYTVNIKDYGDDSLLNKIGGDGAEIEADGKKYILRGDNFVRNTSAAPLWELAPSPDGVTVKVITAGPGISGEEQAAVRDREEEIFPPEGKWQSQPIPYCEWRNITNVWVNWAPDKARDIARVSATSVEIGTLQPSTEYIFFVSAVRAEEKEPNNKGQVESAGRESSAMSVRVRTPRATADIEAAPEGCTFDGIGLCMLSGKPEQFKAELIDYEVDAGWYAIQLSWQALSFATGYDIDYDSDTDSDPDLLPVGKGTTRTVRLSFAPGEVPTFVRYRVRGRKFVTEGAHAGEIWRSEYSDWSEIYLPAAFASTSSATTGVASNTTLRLESLGLTEESYWHPGMDQKFGTPDDIDLKKLTPDEYDALILDASAMPACATATPPTCLMGVDTEARAEAKKGVIGDTLWGLNQAGFVVPGWDFSSRRYLLTLIIGISAVVYALTLRSMGGFRPGSLTFGLIFALMTFAGLGFVFFGVDWTTVGIVVSLIIIGGAMTLARILRAP